MAKNNNLKLTSVKIVDHLFEDFKFHQLDINLIYKN